MKMNQGAVLFCWALALASCRPGPARADFIRSSFDSGGEGWGVGGGVAAWQATGGNPGGYLQYTDTIDGAPTLTALAPAAFLGDLSAYDRGTLAFDSIFFSGNGNFDPKFGRVQISNGSLMATLDLAPLDPIMTWATYSATLNAASWGVSQVIWSQILANVTAINIALESKDKAGEVMGLDNVVLATNAAVPEPRSFILLGIGSSGLAGVGWFRRRAGLAGDRTLPSFAVD